MSTAEYEERVDLKTGQFEKGKRKKVAQTEPLRTDLRTGQYEGSKATMVAVPGSRPIGGKGEKGAKAPRPAAMTPAPKASKAKRADATSWHNLEASGDIAVRADAEGDGLTIEGIAIRYDVPTRPGATREFPGMRESFAPGAFTDVLAARGSRPIPLLDEHDGTVIGSAELIDSPEGLKYRGRLLTSQAARDFAERVRAGVVAPSIEFIIGAVKRAGDTIVHTRVESLGGIAGTYKPAYSGTTFAVRQEETDMEEATEQAVVPRGMVMPATEDIRRIAAEAAEEVVRRQHDGMARAVEADPFSAYRSLGELMHAAAQPGADTVLRTYVARTLADQLTTDSNAGVTTLNTLTNDIKGLVSRGRRAITAFGGPRPLPDGPGMNATWPYFDGTLSSLIGVQATQKTEITSVKVQIKQGTEPIQTFAGGSDIAFQLIERSDPSYLEAYARIMLLAYAVVTDAAFVTELESGTVTGDMNEAIGTVDATELLGLLVDASIAVETATGAPADFVLASTTAFTAAAKLFTPTPVSNARGTLDLPGLQVAAGGLPVIHVPSITAGKFIVSNQQAAGWYESGPFQIQATDVAKLGLDVAYWGMGVPARFIPAGIIEVYDVIP